jgi:hypothetical protein
MHQARGYAFASGAARPVDWPTTMRSGLYTDCGGDAAAETHGMDTRVRA